MSSQDVMAILQEDDLVTVSFGAPEHPIHVSQDMPLKYWSMCNLKFDNESSRANMPNVTDVQVAKAIERFVANRQGIDCTKPDMRRIVARNNPQDHQNVQFDINDCFPERDVYDLIARLDATSAEIAKNDETKKPTDLLVAFMNVTHEYGFESLMHASACYFAFYHLPHDLEQARAQLGL